MEVYIHEKENWTDFNWDNKKVMIKLGEARNQQGRLLSKMESLGVTYNFSLSFINNAENEFN